MGCRLCKTCSPTCVFAQMARVNFRMVVQMANGKWLKVWCAHFQFGHYYITRRAVRSRHLPLFLFWLFYWLLSIGKDVSRHNKDSELCSYKHQPHSKNYSVQYMYAESEDGTLLTEQREARNTWKDGRDYFRGLLEGEGGGADMRSGSIERWKYGREDKGSRN